MRSGVVLSKQSRYQRHCPSSLIILIYKILFFLPPCKFCFLTTFHQNLRTAVTKRRSSRGQSALMIAIVECISNRSNRIACTVMIVHALQIFRILFVHNEAYNTINYSRVRSFLSAALCEDDD